MKLNENYTENKCRQVTCVINKRLSNMRSLIRPLKCVYFHFKANNIQPPKICIFLFEAGSQKFHGNTQTQAPFLGAGFMSRKIMLNFKMYPEARKLNTTTVTG